jgi:hypothetical protein
MRRGLRTTALALSIALAGAAPATAEAPWSVPGRVAGATGALQDLWFMRGSVGIVTSVCCGGYGPGVPATRFAFAGRNDRFGAWRRPSRGMATLAVAGTGSQRFAFGLIPGPGRSTDTGVARLTAKGLRRPFRVLPAGVPSSQIARVSNGTFAIIGQVSVAAANPATRRSIYLTVHRPGRRFTRAAQLAGGGDRAWLSVATTPQGRALAAWARTGTVVVRERSAKGRLGAAQQIATDSGAAYLSTAVAPDGTAAVAWISYPLEAGQPTALRVAIRPRGGTFGAAQTIESFEGDAEPVQLAAYPDGRIQMAWIGHDDAGPVARAAQVKGGVMSAPQTVSGVPALDLHLATGPAGEAALSWVEQPSSGVNVLHAAVQRPAAATMGAPETVAGPGSIVSSELAVDPRTGRVVVAWHQGVNVNPPVLIASRPGVR